MEDNFHARASRGAETKEKGSSLTDDNCQKEGELASRNVIQQTVTWLSESPPINPKKGDIYVLRPS